jgi:hypothetical protein
MFTLFAAWAFAPKPMANKANHNAGIFMATSLRPEHNTRESRHAKYAEMCGPR